ncbi:MAG TPA: trimethylamine methyltransferase family protein [Desulfobacterales bacterium]
MQSKPRLQVVDDDQIRQLHAATAQVLVKTGIRITHAKARAVFADAGARVETDRVYIPRDMLEDAIEKAPSRVVLGNRGGEAAVILEEDRSWFGATLDDIYYFDPETHQRRQMTLDDCRKVVTLSDALANFTWGMTFGTLSDVPAHLADRYTAKQALTYSEKPIVVSSNNVDSLRDIHAMARIVSANADRFQAATPIASFVTTISPLVIPDHVIEQMMYCAEHGIPQVCYNGIQTGSTAPMSFAGAIVQGNAETLAGLVYIQLLRPGSPVVFGSCASIMDMRSTIFSFGAAEMNLMIAAQAQIARHYGIPFYGTAGCSDAKLPDGQAAAEAVFSCMSSMLTGANLVHDAGLLEYATMISPEHMVLVNEVLYMVGQFARGIAVDSESLALDVIDRIGPGGHYLDCEHTMRHFHDVWYSNLFDRNTYWKWQESGGKDLAARLQEQTLERMRHQPAPLPAEAARELDEMARHWQ